MYPKREVFSHSPLALVAAEVRFSDAARLRQQETRDRIQIALEARFPIAERFERHQFTVGPNGPQPVEPVTGIMLKNLARTESLSIASTFIAYETTNYEDFDILLSALSAASTALLEAGAAPALERIGLRYIDEIRVPGEVSEVGDWSEWIDSRLLSVVGFAPHGATASSMQGHASYDLGAGRQLNFQYAALNGPSVVGSENLLRVQPEVGPFFVLDFDAFETFVSGGGVLLNLQTVESSLSAVHSPAGATFQESITDQARNLFRGGLL